MLLYQNKKKGRKSRKKNFNTFQQNGLPLILMSCSLRVSFSQVSIANYESKVQSYQMLLPIRTPTSQHTESGFVQSLVQASQFKLCVCVCAPWNRNRHAQLNIIKLSYAHAANDLWKEQKRKQFHRMNKVKKYASNDGK